eukprot:2764086-Amphidinium_carterae.1
MCLVAPRRTCLATPLSARLTQRETRSLAFLVLGLITRVVFPTAEGVALRVPSQLLPSRTMTCTYQPCECPCGLQSWCVRIPRARMLRACQASVSTTCIAHPSFISLSLVSDQGRDPHCGGVMLRTSHMQYHIAHLLSVTRFLSHIFYFCFVVYIVSNCTQTRLGTALKTSAPREHAASQWCAKERLL